MDLSLAIGMILDPPRSVPVSKIGTVSLSLKIGHGFYANGTLTARMIGTLHALLGNKLKTTWQVSRVY